MDKYYWKITKDIIGCGDDDKVDGPRGADKSIPTPFKFKMYDDDGELYYQGECSHEEFYPLDDFGMPNAGCTEIKYFQSDGTLQTL